MKPTRPIVMPLSQRIRLRFAVTAAIRPQSPPASANETIDIRPSRMPARRAATGLIAQARIARPTLVKRKSRKTRTSATAVVR
ncbi:unannotated protein [freshwater metagenome]|uniref:Unannotated protein n=1 Tax=freshwater metagenome TaxID=449393 RepID=A0A6J7E9H9_9ZZZZ